MYMHWRIYSYINPYFSVSFRSLVGRNTQSHPLNWAVITEHKFTYDACHYYSWTLIHESLYDIRIQNVFKSMIYGFKTDSKQWYTDSNWYDTWYTDTQTVSPMIRDTPIHGLYHLRISIPKIPGYSVIHKQYPWYSDTGMTHWPPGITICIL